MRIYVDAPIHRWRGQLWCHVFSPDIAALHSFMASIGSKREWFQDPSTMSKVSWPHYDANERRRDAAIRAGAIPLGRHQTVVMSRVVLNRWYGVEGTADADDPLGSHRRRNSPMLPRLEEWLEREMRLLDASRGS